MFFIFNEQRNLNNMIIRKIFNKLMRTDKLIKTNIYSLEFKKDLLVRIVYLILN